MSTPPIPGTPVLWPPDGTHDVIRWARRLGNTTVEAYIDRIQQMFGDLEAVDRCAQDWTGDGTSVSSRIATIRDSVADHVVAVNYYWEGLASDYFTKYAGDLQTVFESLSRAAADIGGALQRARETITDAIREAVAFLTRCIGIVLEAQGGLASAAGELVDTFFSGGRVPGVMAQALAAVAGEIAGALATFVTEVGRLIQRYIGLLEDFRGQTVDPLKDQLGHLEGLDTDGQVPGIPREATVTDPRTGGWIPKTATS